MQLAGSAAEASRLHVNADSSFRDPSAAVEFIEYAALGEGILRALHERL